MCLQFTQREERQNIMSGITSVLQHDEGSNCGNLGSTGGKGRYLMFPQATSEVRENNDRLSPCSIQHISKVLRLKKDDCFVGEKERARTNVDDKYCVLISQDVLVCVYVPLCLCRPVSDQPICGNQIVEEGEECDVGQNDKDLCCYSAKEPRGVQCRIRPGKVCRYFTSG